MTAGRALTDEQRTEIVARLRRGWTRQAIAADMALSRYTVSTVSAQDDITRGLRPSALAFIEESDSSWRWQALCGQIGPGFTDMTIPQQKRVCWGIADQPPCPVREQCQAAGMAQVFPNDPADWPVWGGYSAHELARLKAAARARGRRATEREERAA